MNFLKRIFLRKPDGDYISENTKIVLSALLVSLFIVNNRWLAVRVPPFATLSLAIVCVILAAFILGTKWAVIVATLGSMLGAIIFPLGGAWFPEITLGWTFTGIIFGLFLYRSRNQSNIKLLVNLIISSLIVYIVIHLFYMSAVLYFRFGTENFWLILGVFRAWPFAVVMVVQIVVAYPLIIFLRKPIDKFLVIDKEEECQ